MPRQSGFSGFIIQNSGFYLYDVISVLFVISFFKCGFAQAGTNFCNDFNCLML